MEKATALLFCLSLSYEEDISTTSTVWHLLKMKTCSLSGIVWDFCLIVYSIKKRIEPRNRFHLTNRKMTTLTCIFIPHVFFPYCFLQKSVFFKGRSVIISHKNIEISAATMMLHDFAAEIVLFVSVSMWVFSSWKLPITHRAPWGYNMVTVHQLFSPFAPVCPSSSNFSLLLLSIFLPLLCFSPFSLHECVHVHTHAEATQYVQEDLDEFSVPTLSSAGQIGELQLFVSFPFQWFFVSTLRDGE